MDENKNTWKNNFSKYEELNPPVMKFSFTDKLEDISSWASGVSD
jgi:hypothetical protein